MIPSNKQNKNDILNLKNEILQAVYPVGSIYMSVVAINPSQLFGGTWEEWGNSRFIVGYESKTQDFGVVEKEGGNRAHRHEIKMGLGWYYGAAGGENATDSNAGLYSYKNNNYGKWTKDNSLVTNARVNNGTQKGQTLLDMGVSVSTGDTSLGDNLPPYIVCYMWKRIS